MFTNRYTKRIDYFAFPRVGSHYLFYCLKGLYDMVMFEMDCFLTEETRTRQNEIRPEALYALGLHDPSRPLPPPIHIDPAPNGIHGQPVSRGLPILCLMREPVPTIYSAYRLRQDRFGEIIDNPKQWLQNQFQAYENFYRNALKVRDAGKEPFLMLHFEELVAGVAPLKDLCEFVGFDPKLDPNFIHKVTRFDNFTVKDVRTFYQTGSNDSWQKDSRFSSLVSSIDYPKVADLSRDTPNDD